MITIRSILNGGTLTRFGKVISQDFITIDPVEYFNCGRDEAGIIQELKKDKRIEFQDDNAFSKALAEKKIIIDVKPVSTEKVIEEIKKEAQPKPKKKQVRSKIVLKNNYGLKL